MEEFVPVRFLIKGWAYVQSRECTLDDKWEVLSVETRLDGYSNYGHGRWWECQKSGVSWLENANHDIMASAFTKH